VDEVQERALQPVRPAGGRVSFWSASAAVFVVNSLLSLSSSRWMLATLQIMTAILAILAALEERKTRDSCLPSEIRHPSRRR
jgi:hypothetical protein